MGQFLFLSSCTSSQPSETDKLATSRGKTVLNSPCQKQASVNTRKVQLCQYFFFLLVSISDFGVQFCLQAVTSFWTKAKWKLHRCFSKWLAIRAQGRRELRVCERGSSGVCQAVLWTGINGLQSSVRWLHDVPAHSEMLRRASSICVIILREEKKKKKKKTPSFKCI